MYNMISINPPNSSSGITLPGKISTAKPGVGSVGATTPYPMPTFGKSPQFGGSTNLVKVTQPGRMRPTAY